MSERLPKKQALRVLCANQRPNPPYIVRGYTDEQMSRAVERADIAEKEKAELMELVERAYREGHQTGRCGGEMSDESDDWQDSEARAILDKHSARDD